MKMSKYGSIEQFRNIVKAVKDSTYYNGKDDEGNVLFDYTRKLPTITFTGYTKLHGCFEKNTLVTLANGKGVEISKLTKGTYILSYNVITNSQEIKQVKDVYNKKLDKDWCKLVFDKVELIIIKFIQKIEGMLKHKI